MQMLFLQSAIDKMDDNFGRAAIIEHAGPLYTGSTSSGESQIRKWMLENDLIEAIIALPTDLFYNTPLTTYIWVLSKNKRQERKGKVQLIDAGAFFHRLRKGLGDKKNEISPEDRKKITELYANFFENENCKIFDNSEFIYREYTIMQPLQRSYSITEKSIASMLSSGALSALYDEAKVEELSNAEELTGKDIKKLESMQKSKPLYDEIVAALSAAVSETKYYSLDEFLPVLIQVLTNGLTVNDASTRTKGPVEKKLLDKIADGLSCMDKKAEIQRDKKGNVLFDKETKDIEYVKVGESIQSYMEREVLQYNPDAVAFFEEKLNVKKPVIKTGAEISFTRYFYKYKQPTPSEELAREFMEIERSVMHSVDSLFGQEV